MYKRKIEEDLDCGIYVAMKIFGGKWKPCIIDAINRGFSRPSQMHKEIKGASARVIDMQLRELEYYGLVAKVMQPGFPLRVDYSLTERGKSVLPLLRRIGVWGDAHKEVAKGARVIAMSA